MNCSSSEGHLARLRPDDIALDWIGHVRSARAGTWVADRVAGSCWSDAGASTFASCSDLEEGWSIKVFANNLMVMMIIMIDWGQSPRPIAIHKRLTQQTDLSPVERERLIGRVFGRQNRSVWFGRQIEQRDAGYKRLRNRRGWVPVEVVQSDEHFVGIGETVKEKESLWWIELNSV